MDIRKNKVTSATSPLLYAAETWEKVYKAFDQINFTAYDYDAVKQSLLDYLKFQYPENFNDYVESSQLIAIVEMFAYISELISYRVDLSVHEVTMPTASRKQSILRLAKLVSYTASRNLPLRGLVKIGSISTSEDVRDSQGNSLANRVIRWNDPNNPLWKEQFFLVINRVLSQSFGNPFKSFQIDDTVFQQYEVTNLLETENERSSFKNGVLKFKTSVEGQDLQFEIVPADVDADGLYERTPNPNAYFNILYADDGYGDASDTTGFMMYLKQGTLLKLVKVFDTALPNRAVDLDVPNINDVDVWVQQVDEQGVITSQWENVPNVSGINLAFNNVANPDKFEIETLEDDRVRLIFGDGDFGTIPTGIFNIWVRQSNSGGLTVSKSQIVDQGVSFIYTSKLGKQESCGITYSLAAALQNSSPSEDAEHIRSAAPSVYYTQNRMVNGQDYNSFMLKDPSILRLKAVNRTFAGQPKYLPWNDASGMYQNVKIFGNDARFYHGIDAQATVSEISSRALIDEILEPALSDPGIYNLMIYAFFRSSTPLNLPFIKPRTRFIEDATQEIDSIPIQEKTEIQGALDRHWYGEPAITVMLDADLSETSALPKTLYAVVNDDTDKRIYDSNVKMVTKNYLTGIYTAVPTPNNVSGIQEAVLRQRKFGLRFNPQRAFTSALRINPASTDPEAIPGSDNLTYLDINQDEAEKEIYTVEITDSAGTFTVYSSTRGYQPSGMIGEAYDNGIISFLIGFPPSSDETIYVGDAFIIDVAFATNYAPTLYKRNLTGRFEVIPESLLPDGVEEFAYDVTDPVRSWVMIVERFDDESGNLAYWSITKRDFALIIESPTTKFWYDQDVYIVDAETKRRVYDSIRILKSNLNADRTQAIGVDHVYSVTSDVKYPDGETNFNALAITPTNLLDSSYSGDGGSAFPLEFLRFIRLTDYVYFYRDPATGRLSPVPSTVYLQNLTYTDDVSGNYVRKLGRLDLDFMWQHFTPNDRLIDPSPSNIIDVYVMTRGYYSRMQNYIRDLEPVEPTPPSSLELRNSYRSLIDSKMISDSVIMHSGRVKLLFGAKAVPELRARFKVIRAPAAKLTGDQIRARVLGIINDYFQIDNWDFGQSFYVTELCAIIHKNLATEISSVVLVPEFPTNYFGDLFHLRSAPDEIIASCASIENIEIVEGLDRLTLKQKR